MSDDLLTVPERALVEALGSVMLQFGVITGPGRSRSADLDEVAAHVHALQDKVLAQAAARAYPERYRLLGDELGP